MKPLLFAIIFLCVGNMFSSCVIHRLHGELRQERERSERFRGYTKALVHNKMFVMSPEDAKAIGLTNSPE